MAEALLTIALLMLPIVIIFGFAGCTGDDPEYIAELEEKQKDLEKKIEDQKQKTDAAAQAADEAAKQIEKDKADAEAKKYPNIVNVDPNLVCYWRLSEGETGNAVAIDSAPDLPMPGEYKNTGGISRNVQGALALVADPNDKGTEFDGTKGYVEVPYHMLLNPPLDFSIEAWVNPTGVTSQPHVVVGSYEVDSGKIVRGYVLEVETSPAAIVRARIGFGSDAVSLEASLGDGSEHGGWRHVVVTYNNIAKQLRIYVNADNGNPDAELGDSLAPVFYVKNESTPLRIGAGQQLTAPGVVPDLFFKGRIDEVALFRAALEGTAVRRHFLAGISVPS